MSSLSSTARILPIFSSILISLLSFDSMILQKECLCSQIIIIQGFYLKNITIHPYDMFVFERMIPKIEHFYKVIENGVSYNTM
jgi:hypothetical protein